MLNTSPRDCAIGLARGSHGVGIPKIPHFERITTSFERITTSFFSCEKKLSCIIAVKKNESLISPLLR